MAEAKHTPGPWICDLGNVAQSIRAPDGGRVATLNHLVGAYGFKGRRNQVEVVANARLLAAAPDLLEALTLMLEANPAFRMKPIGSPGSGMRASQDQQIFAEDTARAAIAKATRGE